MSASLRPWLAVASYASLGFALFFSGWCLVSEYDIGWYLASGEQILESGGLAEADPFTYTADKPWQNHMWLTHVLVALLHRALGMLGLALWQGLLLVAVVAALVWAHSARGVITGRDHDPLAGLAPVGYALGAMLLREILSPRGQAVSNALFALTLALAIRDTLADRLAHAGAAAGDGTASDGPRRRLYLYLPIGMVWTQVHGGNPDGVLLLGLLWLAGPTKRRALYTLVAAALTCVGPYGPKIHAHLLGGYGALDAFREWLPLHVALQRAFIWHIPYVILIAAGAWALVGRRRAVHPAGAVEPVRFQLLALGAFTLAATLHIRFLHEATIVATAALAPRLSDVSLSRWLTARRLALPATLLGALALGGAALALSSKLPGVGLAPGRFPVGAVRYLREHRPAGPMFNSANFGGYLAWRGPPGRVFIDGRALIVASPALLASVLAAYDDPRRFEALQRRYGFRLAVLQRRGRGARLAAWLSAHPAWRVAYADDVALVLTRAAQGGG